MSSARDSNWRPQPPNLQELEKKEAAAMPVMFSALVHPPGGKGGPGAGAVNEESLRGRGGSAAERGAAEQTPGGQTGQRRTQLGGRRDGGGGEGGRAGWLVAATSRPAYLLGCWDVSLCL